MDRRDFLKALAVAGAAVTVRNVEAMDVMSQSLGVAAGGKTDLVAVMGGEPEAMFRRAIAAGIGPGKAYGLGMLLIKQP